MKKIKILLSILLFIVAQITLFGQSTCTDIDTLFKIPGSGNTKAEAIENAKQNALKIVLLANYEVQTMGNGYKKDWLLEQSIYKTDEKGGFIKNFNSSDKNIDDKPQFPTDKKGIKTFWGQFFAKQTKKAINEKTNIDTLISNLADVVLNGTVKVEIKEIYICKSNIETVVNDVEDLFSIFKFMIFMDTISNKYNYVYSDLDSNKYTPLCEYSKGKPDYFKDLYTQVINKFQVKGFEVVEPSEYEYQIKLLSEEPLKTYYNSFFKLYQPNEMQKIGLACGIDFSIYIKKLTIEKKLITDMIAPNKKYEIKVYATIATTVLSENRNFVEKTFESEPRSSSSENAATQLAFQNLITKLDSGKNNFFDIFNEQIKDMLINGFPIVGCYSLDSLQVPSQDFVSTILKGCSLDSTKLKIENVRDLTTYTYKIDFNYKSYSDIKNKVFECVRKKYGTVYNGKSTFLVNFLSTTDFFCPTCTDKVSLISAPDIVYTSSATFKIKCQTPVAVEAIDWDSGQKLSSVTYNYVPVEKTCFVTVNGLKTGENNLLIHIYPHGAVKVKVTAQTIQTEPTNFNIKIISPENNSTVPSNTVIIKSEVTSDVKPGLSYNVKACIGKSKSHIVTKAGTQIKINVNTYSFQDTLEVEEGCNKIIVTAKTPAGKAATDSVEIIYLSTNIDTVPENKLYVLSIGVSDYDEKQLKLDYPAEDSKDIIEAFTNQKGMVFKNVETTKIINSNATQKNIKTALSDISHKITTNDFVIIHFSGHGGYDEEMRYYLYPYDVDDSTSSKLFSTGLDINDIKTDLLSKLPCGYLLILDACYSGAMDVTEKEKGNPLDATQNILDGLPKLKIIFMSSKANQQSKEDVKWENGAYTEAILSAFQNKEIVDKSTTTSYFPDKDQNGYVSLYELDYYVKHAVKIVNRQPNVYQL